MTHAGQMVSIKMVPASNEEPFQATLRDLERHLVDQTYLRIEANLVRPTAADLIHLPALCPPRIRRALAVSDHYCAIFDVDAIVPFGAVPGKMSARQHPSLTQSVYALWATLQVCPHSQMSIQRIQQRQVLCLFVFSLTFD